MIRPLAIAALTLASVTAAHADPVRGVVLEAETGEPVAGAFVQIGGPDGIATIADDRGEFMLDGVAPGAVTLSVTASAYTPVVVEVASADRGARVTIRLELDLDGAEVIEIEGSRATAGSTGSYALSSDELRTVPGAGNDALKSLQTLPGVSRVPFGAGGLVLRGSSPRDSTVYLDGIEVPILYHFGGLASFYPTGMLDEVELVPSAFGAQYGRAKGGLVSLTGKPGRTDRWRAAGEMSLIDASVRADGPAAGGALSFGLRRSYVDAVLALAVPDDSDVKLVIPPRYYDAQLRYDVSPTSRDTLTVFAFGSDDKLQLQNTDEMDDPDDPDGFGFGSRFIRVAARWRHRRGGTVVDVTPWLGADQNRIRVGDQGSTRTTYPIGLRASATRVFDRGSVAAGVDVQGARYELYLKNEPPPMPGVPTEEITRETSSFNTDAGFWLEGLYRFDGGRLALKPGMRLDRYGISGEWVVDPRLTVTHDLPGDVQLRESMGIYHQPASPVDDDWGNPSLKSSYSTQAAAGAAWNPSDRFEASATGFYDQSERIAVDVVSSASPASAGGTPQSGGAGAAAGELLFEQFGAWSYRDSVGRGRSYGVELTTRATGDSFYAWVSYTYSRSLRRDDPSRFSSYRPYVLDQPHVLTALGSGALGSNWRLGARVRFASGNPFTPVDGVYFDTDSQSFEPIDGAVLSARLPSFFQLDLRLDRTWQRDWGTVALFLDVQNATNRVNAEGVSYNFDYSEIEYTRGLPIFPSLGLEYRP